MVREVGVGGGGGDYSRDAIVFIFPSKRERRRLIRGQPLFEEIWYIHSIWYKIIIFTWHNVACKYIRLSSFHAAGGVSQERCLQLSPRNSDNLNQCSVHSLSGSHWVPDMFEFMFLLTCLIFYM